MRDWRQMADDPEPARRFEAAMLAASVGAGDEQV
jgi:hypothetical protein